MLVGDDGGWVADVCEGSGVGELGDRGGVGDGGGVGHRGDGSGVSELGDGTIGDFSGSRYDGLTQYFFLTEFTYF